MLHSIYLEFQHLNAGFFKDLAYKEWSHFIVQPYDEWHTPLDNLPERALIWLSLLGRLGGRENE